MGVVDLTNVETLDVLDRVSGNKSKVRQGEGTESLAAGWIEAIEVPKETG